MVCGLFGAVIAIPSLRGHGISLAVATLAVGTVIFDLVLNDDRLSGGQNGITQFARLSSVGTSTPPCIQVASDLLCSFLCCFSFLASQTSDDPLRAEGCWRAIQRTGCVSTWVNIYAAKVYAFIVSSAIAGVGGALFPAFSFPVVTSGNFDMWLHQNFVTATVVGGVGALGGALIGATIIPGGFVTQIFFGVQQINAWIPLFGSLGLLFVLRRNPSGLFEMNREFLQNLFQKLRARRAGSSCARANRAPDVEPLDQGEQVRDAKRDESRKDVIRPGYCLRDSSSRTSK